MSKLLQIMLGAAKSNTIQVNGIFLAIWSALVSSDFIQSNPDFVQIVVGIQAVINLLLRFKTDKPLSQR